MNATPAGQGATILPMRGTNTYCGNGVAGGTTVSAGAGNQSWPHRISESRRAIPMSSTRRPAPIAPGTTTLAAAAADAAMALTDANSAPGRSSDGARQLDLYGGLRLAARSCGVQPRALCQRHFMRATIRRIGYDQAVAVDPNDPTRVFFDTFEIFFATQSGTYHLGYDTSCAYTQTGLGMHADQHVLTFVPGSSSILLTGSDGGVDGAINANDPSACDRPPLFQYGQRN